jgi:predicted DNA-binding transcriptional regulator YafY
MTAHSRGNRRSSLHTFSRRLLIIRALLREPLDREQVIAVVRRELGEEAYPEQATIALKHDLDALKREYGCVIRHTRGTGRYELRDLGQLALLDLPDTCLEALAFIDSSFPDGATVPATVAIRALLKRIEQLLPEQRRAALRAPSLVQLQLGAGGDVTRIDQGTLRNVRRAITSRRQLRFAYLSSYDTDTPRTHTVEPYRIFFSDVGHGYLDCTHLTAVPSRGEQPGQWINYRLDRIVANTVTVLNQVLPPTRRQPPSHTVSYTLSPRVARHRNVAHIFPHSRFTWHDDGSASVTATVTDLWQARLALMRYAGACTVTGPPQLVAMMREAVAEMMTIYGLAAAPGDG